MSLRDSSEGTDRDHWGGDWGSVSSSDDEGESPMDAADTQPRKLRTRRSGSLKAEVREPPQGLQYVGEEPYDCACNSATAKLNLLMLCVKILKLNSSAEQR